MTEEAAPNSEYQEAYVKGWNAAIDKCTDIVKASGLKASIDMLDAILKFKAPYDGKP